MFALLQWGRARGLGGAWRSVGAVIPLSGKASMGPSPGARRGPAVHISVQYHWIRFNGAEPGGSEGRLAH